MAFRLLIEMNAIFVVVDHLNESPLITSSNCTEIPSYIINDSDSFFRVGSIASMVRVVV